MKHSKVHTKAKFSKPKSKTKKKSIHEDDNQVVIIHEIELLLAEKRTYFSLLRTGLAIFTVPLTVIAVLAATVEYHNLFNSLSLGAVTIGTLAVVALIGLIMFFRAEEKIKAVNNKIVDLEQAHDHVDDIII